MKLYVVLKYNSEYNTNDIIGGEKYAEYAADILAKEVKARLVTLCDLSKEEAETQWNRAVNGLQENLDDENVTVCNYGKPKDLSAMIYYGGCYEESWSISEVDVSVYFNQYGTNIRFNELQ